MQFELTGQLEHPHRLTFEGTEITLVSAAFKEHIYNLAQKGNAGSISENAVDVASWESDDTGEPKSVEVGNYENIVEVLEDFHENTSDALMEIVEITATPAYANETMAERHTLGSAALKLAEAIREKANPLVTDEAKSVAPITDEDFDAGIRRLLSEERPHNAQ